MWLSLQDQAVSSQSVSLLLIPRISQQIRYWGWLWPTYIIFCSSLGNFLWKMVLSLQDQAISSQSVSLLLIPRISQQIRYWGWLWLTYMILCSSLGNCLWKMVLSLQDQARTSQSVSLLSSENNVNVGLLFHYTSLSCQHSSRHSRHSTHPSRKPDMYNIFIDHLVLLFCGLGIGVTPKICIWFVLSLKLN